MKPDRFDELMRNRARQEKITVRHETDLLFQNAMKRARLEAVRQPEPVRKKSSRKVWAIVAAECIAAAILLLLIPVRDVTRQSAIQRQTGQTAAMKPVTQGVINKGPSVRFDMVYLQNTVTLEGRFENLEDDDTWLVQCEAMLDQPEQMKPLEYVIMLEPGAECVHQMVWENVDTQQAKVNWRYTAYRVTADMLYWLDGEALKPTDEDYQDQQLLMQDAFETQALILEAGDWSNGMAGPVRVLLPDQYIDEHAELSVVEYCVQNGLLEDGSRLCSGEDTAICTKLQ